MAEMRSELIQVRITPAERAALDRLRGPATISAWVRDLIQRADRASKGKGGKR